MTTFLIGGGWTPSARSLVYGPFLAAAGREPTIACVVFDEGDGEAQFDRWANALVSTAPCSPQPVLVADGETLDVEALGGADGVLVCGGHTPSYATALAPAADGLAAWLADGSRPYAGFSAGAAIASRDAIVGGWRANGVPVCPEDAGEDLDEISVVPGLGLAPFSVDVHAAQWGTLGRAIAAVRAGGVASAIAIDEDTVVAFDGDAARVAGLGLVHRVTLVGSAAQVRSFRAGETIE